MSGALPPERPALAPAADAPLGDWLTWIAAQHPQTIALGLDRVREVAERLQLPPKPAPLTLLIAGTNGKGSSLAYLRSILGAAGLRVASYLSPHLLDFRERLQLGADYASALQWTDALARVEAARRGTPLTYFEASTLAALCLIAQSPIDAAILEVGLGGRLDAVNLVDADAQLITTIDLDHQAWLGTDRETIGAEKAGVLRPGRAAVYADLDAVRSIPAHARQLGAPLQLAGVDYRCMPDVSGFTLTLSNGETLRLPLPALAGAMQIHNAAACVVLLEALRDRWPRTPEAYATGLRQARMPGRLQRIRTQPPITVDVAHNPQAARALASWLATQSGPVHAVFGLLDDKDLGGVLDPLLPHIARWYCVSLDPISPRGRPAPALLHALQAAGAAASAHLDVESGLQAALAALPPNGQIIVFGSFLTVEGGLRACGITAIPPLP
ncbi:MAG: bifunctional folylpolyglutamate synthase/dihydrofolate synthase [Xanthomonadales bacterium]|jgi:dihydrofolate synthase/folylpolyglutamate synthase|nr:bifunctional folylpolyglutamate synthase/dihydrofolate synthase [Xanthomonadales bacterium]